MLHDLPLAGSVAVVTGAGGEGCGTQSARTLAGLGATVVANGLPHHQTFLEELAASAPAGNIVPWTADVADRTQVEAMIHSAANLGPPVILIHNAATSIPATDVDRLTVEDWHRELSVILDGAFHLSAAMAPHMRQARRGRLIFISSNAARRGARGRSASYSAAKAGLHGLAMHLAVELGPVNVTANVVAPSQIDTPRARRGGRRDDAAMKRTAALVPLGRVANPDDVAAVVGFLASPSANYVNGQIIGVDGGSFLAPPATRPAPSDR